MLDQITTINLSEIWIVYLFFGLMYFLISVFIAVWVFRDASTSKSQKENAPFWLVFVIVLGFFGLIIYFLIRDRQGRR